MPEDKVENFSFSEKGCSFDIKGITHMSIQLVEKIPFESVFFSSQGLSKFNFNLKVHFEGEADSYGKCRVDLSGDLNPFIKKMAEKPLLALVNSMSLKLSQLQLN